MYIIMSHHWSCIYPDATLRAEYWRTHGDQTLLEGQPLNVDNLSPSDADSISDGALILALQAGDDQAAETLVRTHAPWMITVAQSIAGSSMLAEECVQEAFINVFRKIGDFEKRSSLKTWLHRIVVNQALMKLRASRNRNESSIDEFLPEFDANNCRIEGPWQSLSTPDEIFERDSKRDLIHTKINQLPDSYRSILVLRDIEELSTQEVAATLNLSEANVKVRLHRARSALKKLLEPVLKGER